MLSRTVTRCRLLSAWSKLLQLLVLAHWALGPSVAHAQRDGSERGVASAPTLPTSDGAPSEGPARSGDLTLPQLIYAPLPDYPAEALAQGREADVPLILTVERDGRVSEAEIVEPVGSGLDEAASAIAKRFVFTPAIRAGELFRSKIRFLYSFRLPVDREQLSTQASGLGVLSARVLVEGVETPLAGASLQVVSANGEVRAGTTDAQGKLELSLPVGSYQVAIEAAGFRGFQAEERVVSGEATDLVYRLAPESTGIVIEVNVKRPPREVTRRTLERREIDRIPGTSGDALRSIESLPGVARPPGLAGLLIVRGSAPGDTQTFINGGFVPSIYHFGGLRSVVPTELLDRIDFYPGNFSARYGQVQGGIVDVGLRSPDTSCQGDYGKATGDNGCYHGLAQADLLDVRGLVQGPIANSKSWTFAVGARRSWIDAWIGPVLEAAGAGVTTAPVYQDFQLIANYQGKHNKLSLRAFGSSDRLEILIRDPLASDPGIVGGTISFGQSFLRGQALYTHQLSDSVELRSSLAVGRDTQDFTLAQLAFNIELVPIHWRNEFAFDLLPGVTLNTGLEYAAGNADFLVRAPEPPRPGESNPGPFTTRQVLESSGHLFFWRPAWYFDAELQPTERLLVVPGMRVDFARDSGHADFGPRVTARYALTGHDQHTITSWSGTKDLRAPTGAHAQRLTVIKGGVGVFHQPPQIQETDDIFGTPGLLSNRAVHYSLGVERELTDKLNLSVEGFYKTLDRQVSREPSSSGNFEYDNAGSGRIAGLETLLKYEADQRFFGWLAYTLSRSTRKDRPGDPEYLFQFDQTHILTVLGSYRLGRGWEFGSRFRVVSGSLDTPVNRSLPSFYVADAAAYTPLSGEPYSRRLPLFHQLDLRIDKAWRFRTWQLKVYLDVLNAYNHPAAEQISYNYDFSEQSVQSGLPILPSLGVRGEF